MGFNIVLFLGFIVLSAFFSASETAIFSLSNLRLRRLQERVPRARTVKNLLKRPTHLLSSIVFGNMLVNIGLSSLSTAIFVSLWGTRGLVVSILFSGTLILFFGEIFPKTLAIYAAERFSLLAAPILNIFSRIFSPFILTIEKVVVRLSSFIIRRSKKSIASDAELRTALLLSKKEGSITAEEEEMISYVLEFKDTWVSEILTARIDIRGIDNKSTQDEVLNTLRQVKHSKFPVYEQSLDHIVGILYAKDVFLNPKRDFRKLLRKPILVPESKRIDDLLKMFLEKNENIAVVLDEYGGTEGLVTLEDIEEEIFGEIYDEFETPEKLIEKIDKETWRIYGKTPIKTVNLELDLELPGDESTLAGFLLSQMEKIPRVGENLEFSAKSVSGPARKDIKFVVERATTKRIISVVLHMPVEGA